MSYITRLGAKLALSLKAHGPTICVTTGVASMGVGTVLACKQTLKLEEVLVPHNKTLERISVMAETEPEAYPAKDAQEDRTKIYGRVGIDMVKLYGVPAAFFGGGAVLVFGAHRVMLKRNATLAIAFTGLSQAFEAYRARVVDELGQEVDQAFYHGTQDKFVKAYMDKGKVPDGDNLGFRNDPYNRVFEQGASASWQNDLGANKMFLHHQQRFAQERLARRGYLYLSEVYESIGLAESDISRVVGWKVTQNPDGSKNFPRVDFGLDTPRFDDDLYKQMNAIVLDFNCMGLIVGGNIQKILEKA